jgi:hypothetical protein
VQWGMMSDCPKSAAFFSESYEVSPACPCDKEERVDEVECLI